MKKLLLVEDAATMREVINVYLIGKGFAISEAVDGAQAIELLERGSFDVVLTDLMMPNVDGLEMTRRIRQSKTPAIKDVPILLYSGITTLDAESSAMSAGVNSFLRKPFGADPLLRAVNALLDARTAPTRLHVRVATMLHCKFTTQAGSHPGKLLDVSLGGALLEANAALAAVGEEVLVIVDRTLSEGPLSVRGHVARVFSGVTSTQYGLRFDNTEAKQAGELREFVASVARATGGGLREHSRLARRLEVWIQTASQMRGFLKDISQGGLGLMCPVTVPISEQITVKLTIAGQSKPLELAGKVVHTREVPGGMHHVGVSFGTLNPRTRGLLDGFLASLVTNDGG